MMDLGKPALAERVLSGIVLGCCIFGMLLFVFCLWCSFFEKRWPDPAFCFVEYNLVTRISQSMPLGAFEYLALDGWGFVPTAILYAIFRIKNPAWVDRVVPLALAVAFAPGIWSHLCYMPLYGCVYLTEFSHPIENSAVLFLAMFTAVVFVLFVRLKNRRSN